MAFAITTVTYVVTLPWIWFGCKFWVGMAYRGGVPPPPEVLDAQIWRAFVREALSPPLSLWSWFAFVFGVIALGICRDIYQSAKTKS